MPQQQQQGGIDPTVANWFQSIDSGKMSLAIHHSLGAITCAIGKPIRHILDATSDLSCVRQSFYTPQQIALGRSIPKSFCEH
jgi:hypothetical protein